MDVMLVSSCPTMVFYLRLDEDIIQLTGGEKMPKVFKSLVEISVWVLFIFGCVLLITTIVNSIAGWISPGLVMAGGGISMVSFVLAAVVARIRQRME